MGGAGGGLVTGTGAESCLKTAEVPGRREGGLLDNDFRMQGDDGDGGQRVQELCGEGTLLVTRAGRGLMEAAASKGLPGCLLGNLG